jgi:protein arginine N-methyltransferase 5
LKCHATLKFTVTQNQCEIHGFAGYFTAELYQSVFYSINPQTHTPGMHSWFPLYFPIKNPFMAYKDQEVSISIWRNHSSSAVWYEWSMQVTEGERTLHQSFIHNSMGKGYSIGL